MALVSHSHDLEREMGVHVDQFPNFRSKFSADEQWTLVEEDVNAAKTVMGLLFTLVTVGLTLGGSAVLLMHLLR